MENGLYKLSIHDLYDIARRYGITGTHYLSKEELISKIEFKELDVDDSKSLKKIFNNKFGVFIDIDYLDTLIDEDDDLDSEDEFDDDGYDGYDSNFYEDDDYDENY